MLIGNTSSFHFPGAAGFKGPCKPCLSRGHRSQISPREPGLVETWRAMLPPAGGGGTLLSAAQVRAWGGSIFLPCRRSPYSAVGRVPRKVVLGKAKDGRSGIFSNLCLFTKDKALDTSLTSVPLASVFPAVRRRWWLLSLLGSERGERFTEIRGGCTFYNSNNRLDFVSACPPAKAAKGSADGLSLHFYRTPFWLELL